MPEAPVGRSSYGVLPTDTLLSKMSVLQDILRYMAGSVFKNRSAKLILLHKKNSSMPQNNSPYQTTFSIRHFWIFSRRRQQ
jgi:hypothetical protein